MTPRRSGGSSLRRADEAAEVIDSRDDFTAASSSSAVSDARQEQEHCDAEIIEHHSPPVSTMGHEAHPIEQIVPANQIPPHVTASLDRDCYMFFDPSNDAYGQTQDLNYLFGTLPSDLEFDTALGTGIFTSGASISTSPLSNNSYQSMNEPFAVAADPWCQVRAKMLSALHSLPQHVVESSFFEPSNLQHFYKLYFKHYNAHFPILHEASFLPGEVPPLLLAALVTLGATLSADKTHFLTSQTIHDGLRWLISSSDAFRPPAPLWCLQALLLVQAHQKMFSSRKHHEMAHIFHASIITLMRRGSSYSSEWTEEPTQGSSLDKMWHLWTEQESSKRAAYFAFIMDAQHASVFGHVPALSVSDLRLPLPSSDAVWDANSASRWKRERNKSKADPPFLQVLRALLARRPLPSTLSPFSRFIVLHGLFSITKHMQSRDIAASDVGAGRPSEGAAFESSSNALGVPDWREALDRAIETWSFSLLSREPSLCLEAAMPLQRIAHVTIHVDLIDFHIFAGAPSLTGNKISATEFDNARRRIQQWIEGPMTRRVISTEHRKTTLRYALGVCIMLR
ncbi:hypothetical protein PMZ80_002041 [Knufia obscura]|uniref:Xylanolytic transcriptional activator regulatory domain-containing protein n=2 Tax=Knufia TaxID=430999 RepID=A0AAN8IN48_9EURO|nr:hypothetical protein PMZ80_002041 [Knufia obscura]KAK5953857.1 hypothetical protein OHC33_005127 [Knufia fluminis]